MFVAATLSLGLALLPFAAAAVHDVQVGVPGKLLYDPEAIFAEPGDQVIFHFHPKAHSVTQSSFADPCGPKPGGIDSGLTPVPANQTDNFPTYTVTVPDKTPMWFYCKQTTPALHCGQGMVFAINCGADGAPNSFSNFKKSALAVGAAAAGGQGGGYGGGYGGGSGGYPASQTYTAPYGGVTIPPPAVGAEVTQTITLDSSTWVTTYTSYPGSPAPTPVALAGAVHTVIVGGPGKLLFDPPHIQAAPRDTVVFEFHQKNHTVTQSSFADPCRRLAVNDQVTGFDSGFFPVADGTTQFPTWSVTINDTAPVWAYCRQKTPVSHCGGGMVFAINSDETGPRNYAAFTNLAAQLNGTAASSNAAPTDAPAAGSGASSLHATGAFTVALAAIVAAML